MKLTWNLSYIYYIKKNWLSEKFEYFFAYNKDARIVRGFSLCYDRNKTQRILFAVTKYKSWEENSFIHFKQHLSQK